MKNAMQNDNAVLHLVFIVAFAGTRYFPSLLLSPNHAQGKTVEKLLTSNPGFVLCIGDDRSDEEMFVTVQRWLAEERDENP